MRNHARAVLFFHSFALLAAACTGERAEVNDSHSFRVAVLTPGPISDQSWNASAYDGLIRIRDSLGADISHIQTKTPAEFEENFRQYGALGYDLVFGHGFEFQDAAKRVAPEFPNTIYVTTGGSTTGPNLAAMSFSFDEPSYLAGMAAASVTKSGTVSVIGGTELPPVKSSFIAFSAGAHAILPGITVLTAFVGNWEDAGAGKEQALAQMARGADVLFQNADAAGLGVFQAVKETPDTWVVGSNANQNHILPDRTLGSVVIDVPHAFLLIARAVKAGTFEPRVIELDTESEVVRWVRNPLVSAIPDSMRTRIDSVLSLMMAGDFHMPAATEP